MKSLADMTDKDVLTGEILSYTKGEIFGLRTEVELMKNALEDICNVAQTYKEPRSLKIARRILSGE